MQIPPRKIPWSAQGVHQNFILEFSGKLQNLSEQVTLWQSSVQCFNEMKFGRVTVVMEGTVNFTKTL
jgi:hypothetical protein